MLDVQSAQAGDPNVKQNATAITLIRQAIEPIAQLMSPRISRDFVARASEFLLDRGAEGIVVGDDIDTATLIVNIFLGMLAGNPSYALCNLLFRTPLDLRHRPQGVGNASYSIGKCRLDRQNELHQIVSPNYLFGKYFDAVNARWT
jgi:hypothetical protein